MKIKKLSLVSFLLSLVLFTFALLGNQASASGDIDLTKPVEFSDENVKKEVINLLTDGSNLIDPSKALAKEDKPNYSPTLGDMRNIKTLHIGPVFDDDSNLVQVTSLGGIEEAINATDVKLSYLKAPDISLVAVLNKVEKLNISNNELKDLDFIKNMTSLKDLNIGNNSISDLGDLEGLVGLEKLTATENNIIRVDDLGELRGLKELYLDKNNIENISPLETLEDLKILSLNSNKIKSLQGLEKMESLEELHFNGAYTGPYDDPDPSGNTVKDLGPLKNLTKLRVLSLQDTVYIEDLEPISQLTNLRYLILRGNNIKDISPLKDLTKLETLYLYKNKVEDISVLAGMSQMKELNFAVNKVKDIKALEGLKKLKDVKGYLNQIEDISPLKDTGAEVINFTRNRIVDLSSFASKAAGGELGYMVMENQEALVNANIIKVEEKDGRTLVTIKNPIRLVDGTVLSVDGNTKLKEEDYEYFEIEDFISNYNKVVEDNISKNIQLGSEGETIVLSIPNEIYEEGMVVGVPFYSLGVLDADFNTYGTFGGRVDFKLGKENFKVSFDSHLGDGISTQVVKEGERLEIPQEPIRKGYRFLGWFLGNEKYDFTKPVYGDMELVARWERIINSKPGSHSEKPTTENNQEQETDQTEDKSQVTLRTIAGIDRTQTSILVSREVFDKSKTVILANKNNYPDALASSSLGVALKAPIILVGREDLDKEVEEEIQRLGASEIILIGGKASLSKDMEDYLSKGYSVERLAGTDRYETSFRIHEKLKAQGLVKSGVILASGESYPDALAAGSLVGSKGLPILLVTKNELPGSIESLVQDHTKDIIIVGGYESVSEDLEKNLGRNKNIIRYMGADRFETSIEVAKAAYRQAKTALVVSGSKYPDALVASGLSASLKAPIILTEKDTMPKEVKTYMKGINNIYIIGGEQTIGSEQFK